MLCDRKLPLVSVIIPIYKAEKYLEECIVSVLEQDYQNMEVILVDDGSPDNCPVICENYAGERKNIQVIHQENKGAGAARNRGIESAEGEYLLFVDADDCLDGRSAVRRLVEKAEEEQADIVTGNFRRFDALRFSEINCHHLKSGKFTRTVDFRFQGFLTDGHLISDCGKLYRTSFLREYHLKHADHRMMEDKLYNMMCCTYGPKYGFIQESVYLYRITENSATQQYKYKVGVLAEAWLHIAEDFWSFMKERGIQEDYEDLLAFHLLCGFFSIGSRSLQSEGDIRGGPGKTVKLLRVYGRHPLVKEMMAGLARGKHVDKLQSFFWRTLVRTASVFVCLRAYWVLVCGIAVFSGIGTERKAGRLKYKRGNPSRHTKDKEIL